MCMGLVLDPLDLEFEVNCLLQVLRTQVLCMSSNHS